MNFSKEKFTALLFVFFATFSMFAQSNNKFKVILDPGHGGKDFGTSHSGNVEKKIVLAVALKVGEILNKNSDIEVVYTRKTDVFVPVRDRSVIANEANGNVFVSIHCNGVAASSASGTETFVMGLSNNKSNLEVAKKENAAIILEDDYKTRYAGFDPSSPESIIGLTLVQEDYISQSIDLASKVQDGFTSDLKRKNRGVKQGPFWVLHGAFMPSILIELGFVSNKEEGAYLNSDAGQRELATSIAQGILSYKNNYYGKGSSGTASTSASKPAVEKSAAASTPKTAASASSDVVFKVQISASNRVLALKPQNFNGLKNVTMEKDGALNKYFYSRTSDYEAAKRLLSEAKAKGYTSAFIVAYKGGQKISVQEAIK